MSLLENAMAGIDPPFLLIKTEDNPPRRLIIPAAV
jgi:hypothetical protein